MKLIILFYTLCLSTKWAVALKKLRAGEKVDFLPCTLNWVEYSFGDSIPPGAVKAGKTNYIVRGEHLGGNYRIGRMDAESGKSYVLNREMSYVEILTNVNKCRLSWRRPKRNGLPEVDLNALIEYTPGGYIGRSIYDDDWRAGNVFEGTTGIQVDFFNPSTQGFNYWRGQTIKEYQVLVSQSAGFQLEIFDFKFADDLSDSQAIDFMGLDRIYNRSPVEVTQTVTHEKTVSESITVSESNSFTWTVGASVEASASFMGMGASATASTEFSSTSSSEKSVSNDKSTTVSISRQITVPALTSVEACSTMTTTENFVLDYTAVGKFTLEHRTGSEINEIFEIYELPYTVTNISENAVYSELKGQFKGTLAMNSEFIVVPADSLTGCKELQKKIDVYKSVKKSKGSKKEVDEAMAEVRKVMAQITGSHKDKVRISNVTKPLSKSI